MPLFSIRLFGVAWALLLCCSLVWSAPIQMTGKGFPLLPEGRADSPQAREYRAGVQVLARGKEPPSAARLYFERSLKIDPKYVPALLGMASVAQAEGKTDQMLPFLQKAVVLAPRAPEVHLAFGRVHLAALNLTEAEKSFATARDLAPQAIPPLLELGEVYMRLPGRQKDAVAAYGKAVSLAPTNPFAQFGLGVAAATTGQRDVAFGALQRAAELAPRDPAPWRAIGRLHLEAGSAAKAVAAFDQGLTRMPGSLPLMLDRVDALAGQGQWANALKQIEQALAVAPASPEVHLKLGDVHQASSRWADAEKSYLKTIALAPGNPLAYNNLAWMTVARRGDAAKAVAWARKAVELSPKSSPFLDTLGWAERAAGNLQAAAVALSKAIELEPAVAGYHFHLGVVQGELKQTAAARASLERALKLRPDGPEAAEAKRLLTTL